MEYSSILKPLDKNQGVPIPWEILDLNIESSEDAIIQILLEKSLKAIRIVSSYPYPKRKGKMIINTHKSMVANKIPRYMIQDPFEREYLAMLAAYKLILRFMKRGRIGNFYKYMAGNLPLYYAREWKKELYPFSPDIESYSVVTGKGIPLMDEFPLPDSPAEYNNIISGIGIKKFSTDYTFYTRVNLYNIMERLKLSSSKEEL